MLWAPTRGEPWGAVPVPRAGLVPKLEAFHNAFLVIQKQWIFNLLLCNDEALGNTKSKVPKLGVMISSGTPGLQVEVGLLKGRVRTCCDLGRRARNSAGSCDGLRGFARNFSVWTLPWIPVSDTPAIPSTPARRGWDARCSSTGVI